MIIKIILKKIKIYRKTACEMINNFEKYSINDNYHK